MMRLSLSIVPLAWLFFVPIAQGSDESVQLAQKLAKVIEMKDGIEAALDLALTELADEHGLQGKIVYDKEAFKTEGVDNVAELMVKLPKLTGAKLGTVLDKLLGQVNGTYLIRANLIEITTRAARKAELDLHESDPETLHRQSLPVVRMTFKEITLRTALDQLAEKYDRTIVVAPQVAEKADAQINARFVNVPLDTVVELLADMVDLKLVRKSNALYVTTPERAEPLNAVEEKRREAIREREMNQIKRLELEAKKPAAVAK